MTQKRHFASDNYAGVHPEVLDALREANVGHAPSYGHDLWTERAGAIFRQHFGAAARAFPVFNGTAANVLGIQAVTRPHHAVITSEGAHIQVDECGAPERFTGCKLVLCPSPDGKIRPADVISRLTGIGDEHRVQPRVVSITQATELGTVYTPEEVRELAETAHANGLLLHMDGARIANAAVGLGVELRAITTDAGVDILSFGGTKNGLMGAEAVVFLRELEVADFPFIRKQGMQLASKMRFLAAQFVALLGGDLWRRNAAHANRMARLLAERLEGIPGVRLTQPVQANGVFARVPPAHIPALQERAFFYVWNPVLSEVRWMMSWDTTAEDVEQFAQAAREIVR
ncbi:MAG TPA: low specificity L-threonine aldolase [Gemmatimonadales bacterium]|nr:low specificity L-threonine aldolase [Gemmatimonadales bacterium]